MIPWLANNHDLRHSLTERLCSIKLPLDAVADIAPRLRPGYILLVDYRESATHDPTGLKCAVEIYAKDGPPPKRRRRRKR